MMQRVNDRARAEEEQGLEIRVREKVIHRGAAVVVRRDADGIHWR